VTGYSNIASGDNHAFLSGANGGGLRDLGTLGGRFSFGLAVNDIGQVAGRSELSTFGQHAFLNDFGAVTGYSLLSDNSTQRAFLFTAQLGMRDLNSFLTEGSGWTLTDARDINELGQIVGIGSFGGEVHAFLLNPNSLTGSGGGLVLVPEPGTGALLLVGVGLLAAIGAPRLFRRLSRVELPR
jgi:probable HAF family extracellular repeat protein